MLFRRIGFFILLAAGCGDAPVARVHVPTPDEPARTVLDESAPAELITRLEYEPTPLSLVVEVAPRCLPDGPTCYPILLAHGFMANPEFLEFFGVADRLRELGYVVVERAVEPLDGVEVRGSTLAEQIDAAAEAYNADKVNIIAQSMGGLESRYAISTMGRGGKVASLTTISTPHRGSGAADALLAEDLADGDSAIVSGVLAALGTQYSDGLADDPKLRAGLEDLAEASAPAFNAANPDDPRVAYQSWAGLSNVWGLGRPTDSAACEESFWNDNGRNDHMDAVFLATAPLTAHGAELTPNDGMVTVASAKWGEFRGCVRADHADEVGQIEDVSPDPDTGFDHLEFYEFLADDVARRGF
jgi:triacylglycerol lipase